MNNNKYQFISEIWKDKMNYKNMYCSYKNIKILNNRYNDHSF